MKENLVGEWKVSSQTIDGEVFYSIVRTKDTTQPEHAGNRESYDVDMDCFTDKDEAITFANALNRGEQPVKPNIFQRIADIKRRLQVIEECDWEKMSDRELDRQDRVAVALNEELAELEELAKGVKTSTTIRIDTSEIDIAQAKVDKLLISLKEAKEILNPQSLEADLAQIVQGIIGDMCADFCSKVEKVIGNAGTQKIANYEIIDTLTTKYNQYAIGFNDNPNTPTPYATWERNLAKDGDGEPQWQLGHYFVAKAEAIKDFDRRYVGGE